MNATIRSSWLIGGWIALIAIVTAVSITMGAKLSTTGLLVALCVAPGIVMALLARGASSPTVAEILHSVETKERRS